MHTNNTFLAALFSILIISISCKNEKKEKTSDAQVSNNLETDSIETYLNDKEFDTVLNNKNVGLYWIKNKNMLAAFTNYGGRLVGLWVPDKNGNYTDVVIGMPSIKSYMESTEPYFGATIGRVGNRIANGTFTLEGKQYQIPTNDGENSLHGGKKGFQDVVWKTEKTNDHTLVFSYTSVDMEEGFPGNLEVKVTYTITQENALKIDYQANTDAPTVVNLTNHAFFNLNGEGSGTILNHKLKIYANEFTPVDSGLIPTGRIEDVKGTPFDFTTIHSIGERIDTKNEQLKFGKGYDHNFVLNGPKKGGMIHAATIKGDKSGIIMDILTEEPGLQFYSGNFMKSKNTLKTGAKDDYRTAFALETQHFPDSPNQENFPSIRLNPDETYHTVSLYKFSVER
ncbi:galactose mutarotase [Galbibacter sp. BG1]|uniref:aldose epimerase family protein n=1 Tax=Galbibacter sp. BG1 TaxID=1170699 RepID=UPI0015B96D15|nr:aldose epimerase family protein [Galbibacter sp. BG1]QLE00213.1 galactose mutarotase [Galbibacter sp. BG1]